MRTIALLLFALCAVLALNLTAFAGVASAHLHPFNPAAACAPSTTGAGNEAQAFFTAPGIQSHWTIVDLVPGAPGIQFLIPLSNPGKPDLSNGAIATPFAGNPGRDVASANCATPKSP